MATKKLVNLDLLDTVAGRCQFNGVEHDVHFVDGEGYRQLSTVAPDSPDYTLVVYDILGRCIPTMGRDGVDRLTAMQAGNLLGIALYGVREVEEQFPNGSGPGTNSETATDSKSPASP